MPLTRDAARKVLLENVGYAYPESWLDYAAAHDFTRVQATRVPRCPDCGSAPKAPLGPYVYYSTLISFADMSRVPSDLERRPSRPGRRQQAFRNPTKDRDYFRRSGVRIFDHLAREISRLTPRQGRVLDIGGAQGDLMHRLTTQRPDVTAVVRDLSEDAVRYARESFGLDGVAGDIRSLQTHAAYLRSRLLRTGFTEVRVLSSPPLVSTRLVLRALSEVLFRAAHTPSTSYRDTVWLSLPACSSSVPASRTGNADGIPIATDGKSRTPHPG